jgi:broad specificity phosphatase PhoE
VALGEFFSSTRFDVIYASTLKRARQTAVELHKKQPAPQPPLIISEDLREQSFGEAEGHPWIMSADPDKSLAQQFTEGKYPVLAHRHEKFPQGETLDDLGRRAEKAIQELVMPHIWKAAKEGRKGVQVAVVSHGLCISEVHADP